MQDSGWFYWISFCQNVYRHCHDPREAEDITVVSLAILYAKKRELDIQKYFRLLQTSKIVLITEQFSGQAHIE